LLNKKKLKSFFLPAPRAGIFFYEPFDEEIIGCLK